MNSNTVKPMAVTPTTSTSQALPPIPRTPLSRSKVSAFSLFTRMSSTSTPPQQTEIDVNNNLPLPPEKKTPLNAAEQLARDNSSVTKPPRQPENQSGLIR